jgi:ABC-type lipoprotein export system ATPase subunit
VTGRHAAGATPASVNQLPLGALVADDVSYRRAGRTILDRVNVRVEPGSTLAVVGPSGSGKSTLLALLAGLAEPDSGTVRRVPSDARLGLVLQAYGLVSLLGAAENVEVALQPSVAAGGLDRQSVARRSRAALEAVGLTSVAEHLVEELSGGQQQRVAIARALVVEPRLVLADEFTAELDHRTKQHALELVLDVAASGGIVVVATHDPDVAERCDRIVHLVDGRLVD